MSAQRKTERLLKDSNVQFVWKCESAHSYVIYINYAMCLRLQILFEERLKWTLGVILIIRITSPHCIVASAGAPVHI